MSVKLINSLLDRLYLHSLFFLEPLLNGNLWLDQKTSNRNVAYTFNTAIIRCNLQIDAWTPFRQISCSFMVSSCVEFSLCKSSISIFRALDLPVVQLKLTILPCGIKAVHFPHTQECKVGCFCIILFKRIIFDIRLSRKLGPS